MSNSHDNSKTSETQAHQLCDKHGWRPIETAPRDGTQILTWDGTDAICCEYRSYKDGTSFWEFAHTEKGVAFVGNILTHWQPLPEAPE